jgi:GDP-mannose pyrophosphatase NudK
LIQQRENFVAGSERIAKIEDLPSMRDKVRMISSELLSDNWGAVTKHTFDLERQDGTWQRQIRETYDRGHGAAVLLYDPGRRTIVLTRQFRFPAWFNGDADPWIIEAPAGKLDGDDPLTCARREAEEETGYRVRDLTLVGSPYMSPGSVTERIYLYVGRYDEADRISDGGGLEHEGEDIETLELSFDEAMAMLERGEIADGKTMILLQYLALKGLT